VDPKKFLLKMRRPVVRKMLFGFYLLVREARRWIFHLADDYISVENLSTQ
jgi:hypothetical protein